jgi:3-oxoadipate enol-lactonase
LTLALTAAGEFKLHKRADIAYLDPNPAGKKVILLLHGLGSEGSSWQLQFPALIAAGYRPLAVDLPGFGGSRFHGRRWSIRAAADLLADWLQGLVAAPLVVAGISMGGTVALRMALDHPDLVERLVLVSTFARLRPNRPGGYAYFAWRLTLANLIGLKAQASFVARRIFPNPDQQILREILARQILQADERVYRAAMLSLGLYNVESRLKNLPIPTLVISGDRDSTVTLPNQDRLARGIAGAQQIIIPDAGHAVIIDQPDRFKDALLAFLP